MVDGTSRLGRPGWGRNRLSFDSGILELNCERLDWSNGRINLKMDRRGWSIDRLDLCNGRAGFDVDVLNRGSNRIGLDSDNGSDRSSDRGSDDSSDRGDDRVSDAGSDSGDGGDHCCLSKPNCCGNSTGCLKDGKEDAGKANCVMKRLHFWK